MADSSTEATPSMISPSLGIISPASTSTRSPLRSCGAATCSVGAARSEGAVSSARRRLASVSLRARRKVSAWALPRPSAIASAKLAKSTVNHSQTATPKMKPRSVASVLSISERTNSMVVMTLPISTTNITGFLAWMRGSSFLKESPIARRVIVGSKSEAPRRGRRAFATSLPTRPGRLLATTDASAASGVDTILGSCIEATCLGKRSRVGVHRTPYTRCRRLCSE